MMENKQQETLDNLNIIIEEERTFNNYRDASSSRSCDNGSTNININEESFKTFNTINNNNNDNRMILSNNNQSTYKSKFKKIEFNKNNISCDIIEDLIRSKNDKITPFNLSSSINIGSLNVQSECNRKLSDILYMMIKRNILILFINETNLKCRYNSEDIIPFYKERAYFSPLNETFTIIYNNDIRNNSGCAFIIHNSIVNHLYKIDLIQG